jgi:hypothetical protein
VDENARHATKFRDSSEHRDREQTEAEASKRGTVNWLRKSYLLASRRFGRLKSRFWVGLYGQTQRRKSNKAVCVGACPIRPIQKVHSRNEWLWNAGLKFCFGPFHSLRHAF